MADFPAGVLSAAREAWSACMFNDPEVAIASAILAERQRCVDVVKAHGDTWSWSDDPTVRAHEIAVDEKVAEIAAAIQGHQA